MKVGVDIGGSHIGIGLVENENKIIKKIEIDLDKKQDMQNYIIEILEEKIAEILKGEKPELIGISVPGIASGTSTKKLDNLGIKEIDFRSLEEKFKTQVHTINDGNAAAIAEKRFGALKDYTDCAFLCLGTGIGGGVFINNKLLETKNGIGFEIGHMVIEREGTLCNCGKKGCFEKYCAMSVFRKDVRKELEKIYEDKSVFEKQYINDLLKDNIDNIEIQKIIDEFVKNLVIGLSNVIDLFGIEAICLGGSFVYYEEYLYNKLVTEMENKKYAFYKDYIPKIVLAEFKNDAGIIGAL